MFECLIKRYYQDGLNLFTIQQLHTMHFVHHRRTKSYTNGKKEDEEKNKKNNRQPMTTTSGVCKHATYI